MFWAATLLLFSGQADPRLEATQFQIEGRLDEALAVVETAVVEQEETVQPLGFHYLRGHLLESLGRHQAAHEAFAMSMTTSMPLAPYSRFRLALNHERHGHPEVSAGLLANLLAAQPPKRLVRPAVEMLSNAILGGADCRLLTSSGNWRLDESSRRRLAIAQAECDLRQDSREAAVRGLVEVLERRVDDEAARLASDRLEALFEDAVPAETAVLLGRAFHAHRRFDLSTVYLRQGLDALESDDLDARYELARSHFWRAEYLLAATEFGKVAAASGKPVNKARALYQQGRCYELNGSWPAAASSFRLAYREDPLGRWADAALLSAMRIEWRSGSEDTALDLYEILGSRTSWSRLFEVASVFLASSEIVRERGERAGEWLERGRRARRSPSPDSTFWSGRLAELEGDNDRAVDLYLDVLTDDPYHPLATAARRRLAGEGLEAAADQLGRNLAQGTTASALYGALLLLPEGDPAAQAARQGLASRLRGRRSVRSYLDLAVRSADAWPLWRASLDQPEELLLALGLWGEGERAILKHFSVEEPDLALTAVGLLEQAGSLRPALRIAEILYQRAIDEVPIELLPPALHRSAFPLHYRDLISNQSERFGGDPFLLAAVVREESRFDTRAVSAAAARGLAQFVMPTAQRLGAKLGMGSIRAEDLHRPDIALTLGAAYLAELSERFSAQPYAVVAAYNAGESQAELWQSYCFSHEPEEYFSKVGFPETRRYLEKVLSSREHYTRLYGNTGYPEELPLATPRTTSASAESGSK